MSHRFFLLSSLDWRSEWVVSFSLSWLDTTNTDHTIVSLGRKFHVTNHHLSISCPHPPSCYVLFSSSFPLSSSLSPPLSSSLPTHNPLNPERQSPSTDVSIINRGVKQGSKQWRGTFQHEEEMSLPVSLLAPKRVWKRWIPRTGTLIEKVAWNVANVNDWFCNFDPLHCFGRKHLCCYCHSIITTCDSHVCIVNSSWLEKQNVTRGEFIPEKLPLSHFSFLSKNPQLINYFISYYLHNLIN